LSWAFSVSQLGFLLSFVGTGKKLQEIVFDSKQNVETIKLNPKADRFRFRNSKNFLR
jgi:hypothetical protein